MKYLKPLNEMTHPISIFAWRLESCPCHCCAEESSSFSFTRWSRNLWSQLIFYQLKRQQCCRCLHQALQASKAKSKWKHGTAQEFFLSSSWFALCSLSRVHKGSIIAAISSHLGQHHLSTADGTENILYFQSNSQEGWRLGLSGGSHAWLSPRKQVCGYTEPNIAVLFLNQTWMLTRPCLFLFALY